MTTAHAPDPATMTDLDLRDEAVALLRRLVGRDDADFRDGQWEAVRALVAQRRRALVVQRTGWGKSAVYFVATALLRARGAGPTVIVSPLLALMRDQVAAAARAEGARGDDQLGQRGRVGRGQRGTARRRGRRVAGQPRTAEQPALPPGSAARAGRHHRPPRRRRGALRLRLGARLPGPTTGASAIC